MARTPQAIAEKWNREWLESKDFAIQEFSAIASQIAQRAINNKQKMIDNFAAVMATTKYEDRLQPYVGSNLLENAYTEAMNAKTVTTPSEQLKIQRDVEEKRAISSQINAVIQVYKDQDTAGEITVPAGVADQGLRSMLIQGINFNQFRLSSASTPVQIYTATKSYMNTNLGWPAVP